MLMTITPDTATLRERLRRSGYCPLPVEGKRPAEAAWQKKIQTNFDEIKLWSSVYAYAENTGILTRLTPTIDIDIKNPEAAEAVEALAREHFEERGQIMVRIGEAPKRAIPLRTDIPFPKITSNLTAPNGETEKIELLCDGQQVVAFGIHPGTGKPYTWHGGMPGEVALDDLPYVRKEDVVAFVDAATALLIEQFGYTGVAARPSSDRTNGGGVPASDWGWLVDNIHHGRELHDSSTALAAKLLASGMSEGATVNFLRGVFEKAETPHDQRWQERYDDIPRDVRSAERKFGGNGAHRQQQQQQQLTTATTTTTTVRPNRASVYGFPDAAGIPGRSVMYGHHYIRDAVTSTVAPGGTGKTTLHIYEALTMAQQGLNVWYISGEDPRIEIDRRIAAHVQHHGADVALIAGHLFIDDRDSFPIQFTKSARGTAVVFDEEWIAAFEHAIELDHIDVVIIDPLVAFHTAAENDNSAMDAVVKRLGAVCVKHNCNIEMSHHVRKPSAATTEITVDDARGGGALVNATRSCRVINRMPADIAAQENIKPEKRSAYLRLDSGKRNMAPPEAASWWQLVSVPIANGLDNVQAIARYNLQGPFGGGWTLADTDAIVALVKEGDARCDPRSDQWLGHAILKRLGKDTGAPDKADVIKVNKMIGTWMANNLFKKEKRHDLETRKARMFYVPIGRSNHDED